MLSVCGDADGGGWMVVQVSDFEGYDYVGAPWTAFGGRAGGGGISLRNRSTMLFLLQEKVASLPISEREEAYKTWGQEDDFFVRQLLKTDRHRLAPREVDVFAI